jgi:hypothetical protein
MAQNRVKQQADQHRSERSFEVGDWVFLRLQPYKQMSLMSSTEVSGNLSMTSISTLDPAPKRSRLDMSVVQNGSWPSGPAKGPVGNPEV